MNDKKIITDDDIITAYGYCLSLDCRNCPLDGVDNCMDKVEIGIPEIYKRQKAEILELQGNRKFVRGTVACLLETSDKQQAMIEKLKEAYAVYEETTGLKQARAEAIKEFAERLKRRMGYCDLPNGIVRSHIDNLVKEMTEGQP